MGNQIADRHNPSRQLKVNEDGSIDVTLLGADIQIGAVEIKDAISDVRAVVDSDGLNVSVKNSVLPTGGATSAKQLADNHQVTANAGTNLNTSALATEATMTADLQAIEDNQTDGTQKTQTVGPTGNIASVTEEGQAATTIFDSDGNRIQIDGLGNMKTAENSQIVGESFEGSVLDDNFWTLTVLNGGTVTQDGQLYVQTNTTANGAASVTSVRKARKIPGTVSQFRTVGMFMTPGQANNVRTVGLSDNNVSENAAYFKLDGTTFKIGVMKNGVATEISSGNFNGDVTEWTPDTDVHRFVIEYTSFVCKFFIDGVLIHKVFSNTTFWTQSLLFAIKLTNTNSNGNTTNNQLHFQLLTIVRLGKLRSAKAKHYQTGIATNTLKYGAGAVIGLILTANANNAVVTLYDSPAATAGTEFFSAGPLDLKTEPVTFDMYGIDFFDGLTLAVTEASATITVVYE